MKADGLFNIFDRDKLWLMRQPGLNPWNEGCDRLSRQLVNWLGEYSAPLCDQTVTTDHDDAPSYTNRMWDCWAYHWQLAAETTPKKVIDGSHVAEAIRSGHGYQGGGQLGGDPLRDVVLAVAIMNKNNRATDQLHRQYFEFCRGMAGKVHQQFFADPDEWWDDFVDFLAGYSKPPGKLARFQGKCGLKNWLGTVLWNFLRRRPFSGSGHVELTDQHAEQNASLPDDPGLNECRELFSRLVDDALQRLSEEDRLILCLLYVDQLMLKQAASILGIHPGNAGRQRDRAAERLRELIVECAAERQKEQTLHACVDDLAQSPEQFADLLYDALKKHSKREDAP